jgi:hypothetical protein
MQGGCFQQAKNPVRKTDTDGRSKSFLINCEEVVSLVRVPRRRGEPVRELPEELGLFNKGKQLIPVFEDAGPQALHSHQDIFA